MSEPQPPAIPPERPSQSVVSLDGAQTGDVSFGDVAGRDINKTTIINQAKLSPEERQAQRNRAALLGRVRRFWVEGVLHESLHQRVRIELGMQARHDAVDHPWRNIVRLPGQAPQALAPGQLISAVFADAGGRMLILGAPGGGKTTTLLTLVEQLLEAAASHENLPIPVVFQLSTWALSKPDLADWLVTELKDRYKVPPKVGNSWIVAGEILLMLDGLDEVGPTDADRAACIQAINAYLGEGGAQAVVCSRSAEYARLGAKLSLDTAIEIQPLDTAQIDCYLAGFGAPLSGLRVAVAEDATLSDLAKSPLLLSVMALAYRDVPAGDLVGQKCEVAYQRLWIDYVQNRLVLVRADAQTDPCQMRTWLIWLARGMELHGQQVFYIEYLQPSWLMNRKQQWLLHIQSGLIGGLLFWLVAFLCLIPVLRVGFGFLAACILGIPLGITLGRGNIKLVEMLSWNLSAPMNWSRIRINLFLGLIGGLIGSLIYILSWFFIYGFIITLITWSIFWLIFGGINGIMMGLAIESSSSLGDLLRGGEMHRRDYPNEGIIRSRINAWRGGLILGGIVGLIYALVYGLGYGSGHGASLGLTYGVIGMLPPGLFGGLIAGIAVGLITGSIIGSGFGLTRYGGSAVIKHNILRRLLHRYSHAPWDFAAALDEAVSRTLMTRVGGGYRFYHRLLQEHFAEHEASDLLIAPILGPQPGERSGGRRQEAGGKD